MVANIDRCRNMRLKTRSARSGLRNLNGMREHAEMIANLDTRTPLNADADTGYGGPNMIPRTVAQ